MWLRAGLDAGVPELGAMAAEACLFRLRTRPSVGALECEDFLKPFVASSPTCFHLVDRLKVTLTTHYNELVVLLASQSYCQGCKKYLFRNGKQWNWLEGIISFVPWSEVRPGVLLCIRLSLY